MGGAAPPDPVGAPRPPDDQPLPDMPVHYRITARIETREFCFECHSMMDALGKGFSLLGGRMEDVRIVDGLGRARTVAEFSALLSERSTDRAPAAPARAAA